MRGRNFSSQRAGGACRAGADRGLAAIALHTLYALLAEQAIRLEQQDDHQEHVRGDLPNAAAQGRIQIARGEILEDSDQDPADDRAWNAVEAPDDADR